MNYDEKQKEITAVRLKELRIERGFSHEKLAKELRNKYNIKISVAVLKNYEVTEKLHSKFETGFGMNIRYLYMFADFYGVSTEYLLGKIDVKTPNIDILAIMEKIELSADAFKNLFEYNSPDFKPKFESPVAGDGGRIGFLLLDALNTILTSEYRDELLKDLHLWLSEKNPNRGVKISNQGMTVYLMPDTIKEGLLLNINKTLQQIKDEKKIKDEEAKKIMEKEVKKSEERHEKENERRWKELVKIANTEQD
ncbi:helix-turn-helix transcriptional regulator [Selenomonadales bacterium OttesenSCG-928-I06]|nr:helix-turn-helix transcriptional regulator [Selenomonadales bacterium OttesenSCG-928-I06]